jgi:hypothetical protein
MLLDRWISRASRSRLEAFVRAARTMRERRPLIVNTLEQRLSNGRIEGTNTRVRLIIRRAYGFHSADAALALIMLAAGPSHSNSPTNAPPHDPHLRQESLKTRAIRASNCPSQLTCVAVETS